MDMSDIIAEGKYGQGQLVCPRCHTFGEIRQTTMDDVCYCKNCHHNLDFQVVLAYTHGWHMGQNDLGDAGDQEGDLSHLVSLVIRRGNGGCKMFQIAVASARSNDEARGFAVDRLLDEMKEDDTIASVLVMDLNNPPHKDIDL